MKLTKTFDKLINAWNKHPRTIDSGGGTRSGKTFSTLQLLSLYLPNTKKPLIYSVVSETLPHLKRGAIRDFKTIMASDNRWNEERWSKVDFIYTFANGSILEFFSADNPAKVHGSARDGLFINECQNISWEIARQLFVRTRDRIILDYNPTHSFWVHDHIKPREDCISIHSTYKDNDFLTPMQVAEIESNKSDKNWWRVYGEGKVGQLEGLVYDFEQIETLPESNGKSEAFGMDFGFSCFVGDTLITTDKGQVPIRNIKAGDKVLTRKGYRRVVRRFDNGIKKTYGKEFDFGFGKSRIFATLEHNFNVNGKWKKYGQLTIGDKLSILSNSMVKSTEDTQTGSTQTITTTSTRRTEYSIPRCCTTQSMNRSMERYPKERSYITLTSTHSTTSRAILWRLLHRNTQGFTKGIRGQEWQNIGNLYAIQRRTGRNAERRYLPSWQMRCVSARTAVQSLRLPTHINDSVVIPATTNGNINRRRMMLQWSANGVARSFKGTSTPNQRLVVSIVPTSCQHSIESIKKIDALGCRTERVYDLQIEGVHEYFANGILVHNCDPTAIVHVVADTGKKELYVQEVCYRTRMLNSDIIEELKDKGVPLRSVPIYADCAEPKSINEIGRAGFNIKPCDKGGATKGAKLPFQIQFVQGWKLFVTKDSVNLIKELRNYTWDKDKDGNNVGYPIDKFNHALDAMRYAVFTHLAKRSTGHYNISIR